MNNPPKSADLDIRICDLIHAEADIAGVTVTQIAGRLGWWPRLGALLYPTLLRLERQGWLTSEWEDGAWPRRRLYFKVIR